MNLELVESLATIINALKPEEKALLQEKVKLNNEGKKLDFNVSETIFEMREERTQELMKACFPDLDQKEI